MFPNLSAETRMELNNLEVEELLSISCLETCK